MKKKIIENDVLKIKIRIRCGRRMQVGYPGEREMIKKDEMTGWLLRLEGDPFIQEPVDRSSEWAGGE